jgi:hypothetical protein
MKRRRTIAWLNWRGKKRGEERRGDMIMEYRMYCPAYRSGVRPQL